MRSIARGAAAAAMLALTTSGLVAFAAPASADTPGCVTHKEFQRAEEGMSIDRIGRIFDHLGAQSWKGGGWQSRQYPTCTGGYAELSFQWNKNRQKWVMRNKYAEWYS